MAEDKKISQFPEITTPTENDLLSIVYATDPNETKRIKFSNLKGAIGGVIATVPNVDLKTVAANLLYTVPAGKILVVQDLIAVITNGDCTFGAIVNLGWNGPTYADIAEGLWVRCDTTGEYYGLATESDWGFPESHQPEYVPAETGLYLNVTQAAKNGAATAEIATIVVIGFLI